MPIITGNPRWGYKGATYAPGSFEGESQIYNIGDPAVEEIPIEAVLARYPRLGPPASKRGPTPADNLPSLGSVILGGRGTVAPRPELPTMAIPRIPTRLPTPTTRTKKVSDQGIVFSGGLPIFGQKKNAPTPTKKVWGGLQRGEANVPIDLGNLLGKAIDVYGSIARADARGPTVAQPVAFNPPLASTTWPGAVAATPAALPAFGIPGVEVIGEEPLDQGYVYKKVCGVYKWVKPGRRRRKKLLTDSDFNALLRIQALKVNQNMTIAIAKALGR